MMGEHVPSASRMTAGLKGKDMTTDAAFWNKAAEKYAASSIGDQAAYEYTLGRTQSYLKPSDTVLEIGCGTGSTALELAGCVARYVGTDISEEMIGYARAKAEDRPIQGLEFRVMPVAEALADQGSADVVCAFSILHLLRDLDGSLAAIRDVLPKGGLFISKTPCLRSMGLGMRIGVAIALPLMRMVGKAPFVHKLSTKELTRKIEAQGFEIVETVPSPKGAHHYVVARKT